MGSRNDGRDRLFGSGAHGPSPSAAFTPINSRFSLSDVALYGGWPNDGTESRGPDMRTLREALVVGHRPPESPNFVVEQPRRNARMIDRHSAIPDLFQQTGEHGIVAYQFSANEGVKIIGSKVCLAAFGKILVLVCERVGLFRPAVAAQH